MGKLFDLEDTGYFYTRLQNPTNEAVAQKITELEGGVAGMLTSSGQAANFYATFNLSHPLFFLILTQFILRYNDILNTFPCF